MADKILEVKNLSVKFEDTVVLENINFSLEKGDNLSIIGPNGSGKTVLLRALLSMVNHDGAIEWAHGIRLGYVPQKIDADRHLPITIQNLLSAKGKVLKLLKSDMHIAIKSARLTEKMLSTPIGHLSGGQFQRALIAFALLGKPDILLLDEPTASIDAPGEEQVYELIHKLQDAHGITVILVSHDLSFVYRYATKVLCLNKTSVCFGSPELALNTEVLEKLYGGPRKYYHHLHEQGS
ncbi:MAG: metal ABC transporter ATP-binding protein [Patescibacteria group bacterium]